MSASDGAPERPVRATMKHVAALAGVGVKTVSRVVNEEPNVSERTSSRVWDAIRELDYQVDLQAGSLRRTDGRTRTLGLLVGSIDNPFAGAIHRAVEDLASARGVAVLAASLDDDPTREAAAVRTFLQRRVDALILTTAQRKPDYLGPVRDRDIPFVYIDREPQLENVDTVASDNREGAAAGTAHLIAHGHRRIALLTSGIELVTSTQRRDGFFDAIRDAGISEADVDVVTGVAGPEEAEEAVRALLGSVHPPTAVFSAQNSITVGALQALHEAGRERTVAFVGFDDLPLADRLVPGLTVIAQNPREIGRLAGERVLSRLDGDTSEHRRIVVPTRLIPRGSGELPPAG